MLTSRLAGLRSASYPTARLCIAILLSIATWAAAEAGGVSDTSCVGGWRGFNCATVWGSRGDPYVRLVPEPFGEADRARAAARDRRWLARCRPTVTRDRYGVARLHYSAPGCEFGVSED